MQSAPYRALRLSSRRAGAVLAAAAIGTATLTVGAQAAQPVATRSAPSAVGSTIDHVRLQATISWAPPVTSSTADGMITGYRVSRNGTDSRGSGAWSTTLSAATRSHTFWNLRPGVHYTLAVRALTSAGAGPAALVGVRAGATGGLNAPGAVTASVDSGRQQASLSWAPPAGGAGITGYRVSRNGTDTGGSGPWSTVLPATARSHTFWNLARGRTYTLSVRALRSSVGSPNAASQVVIGSQAGSTPPSPGASQTPRPTGTATAAPTTTAPAPPATAPGTPPAASARDHTLQPFSRTSIWNLPIGTGATFESAGHAITANLVNTGGAWVNESTYSHPVVRARAGDPLATVRDTNDASRSGSYRIPADAAIAKGTDAHLHVISPDGRVIDEAWAMQRQSSTSYTAGRHHTVDLFGSGMGPRNGTRAYGGSAVGGLIRAWEVDPAHPAYTGAIRHPIAMALRDDQLLHTGGGVGYRADGYMLQSGYVWPATEQDYDSPWSYRGRVPMGTYFAIPPGVDLRMLGLTPQGLMLARAYQDYGGYVTDRSGETMLAYVEPSAAGNRFTNALLGPNWSASDLKKIKAQLRRVTNNSAATPNGAPLNAPRRAPLLPH